MRGLAGLSLGDPPPRRRLNLTPMIDVVFLLVVFFMLASRFAIEGATPVAGAAAGAAERWDGPPRLIDLEPEGVRLNGVAIAPEGLAAALAPLMSGPGDPVLLRPAEGVGVQAALDLIEALGAAGIDRVLLVAP